MLTSERIEGIREDAVAAAAMDPLDEPSFGRDALDLISHIWEQAAEIERQTDKQRALEAENEGLKECLVNEHNCGIGFQEQAEKYKAEIERLRAALEEITAQEYLSDPDSEGHGDCVRIAVAALEGDTCA